MGSLYNLQSQTRLRKILRKQATEGECVLWSYLKGKTLGVKFRRQYGVEHYVLDFYCPSLRLAIEVDGSSHDDEETKSYDEHRQKFIEAFGIKMIRFTEEAAVHDSDEVVEEIRRTIIDLS